MTEPTETTVFVNERPVRVPRDARIRDAVRAFDAAEGEALAAGTRRLADSRGLELDADTPVHGGVIVRILPVRAAGGPSANAGTGVEPGTGADADA